MPVKMIKASDVEIGMYVSRLDRPWQETSFLFQGFPVRNETEIEELKQQCRHVYIMVPDEDIEISAVPAGQRETAAELFGRQRYETTRNAREEVLEVHQAHGRLVDLLSDVDRVFRETRELKIDLLADSVELMVESVSRNPDAYLWLNRIKRFDSYVYRDALNASVWAASLGRELGLEKTKLNSLATGALLMDIGKTELPNALLHKRERLSDNEWAIMKTHVEHGLRILSENEGIEQDVLDVVRCHHERLDGSGYPSVLRGDQIPLLAQIAGIVDLYVSVTTPRPYAEVVSPSNAIYMLYQQQGKYFSEVLVRNFIQAVSTYPTGALVELSSGEVAVVISQNPGLRLRPNVVLILDPNKQPYGNFPVVSLVDYCSQGAEEPVTIRKTLPEGSYGVAIEELTAVAPEVA